MEIVFNKPLMLLWSLILPVLVILHYYYFQHNKKRAMKFANFSALKRVTGTKLITKNNPQLIVRIIALMLLIISAAQPIVWYDTEVSSTDYIITIDTSASMVSTDVQPSRLQLAKQSANAFISSLESKTKIGVVSFAGVSFIKSPLTDDINSVKMAINSIDIQLTGGTDIGSALVTSVNLFNSNKSKAIILITDGSDTAGSFVGESVETALNYVRKNQVVVHTISVGTGLGKVGYLEGVDLPSIYDKSSLEKTSEATGGRFYEVKNSAEIAAAFKDIENIEEGRVAYDLYNIIFLLAFFMLIFEWGLLNTKFRPLP